MLTSLSFDYCLGLLVKVNRDLAPMICVIYPLLLGSIKYLQMKSVAEFDMDDVYEFAGLALAAFPYRFVFFGIDTIPAVSILITIKFGYKFYQHFIRLMLEPYILILKMRIKEIVMYPFRK